MRFLTTAWGQLVPVVLEELDVEAGLEADSVAAGFDSLEIRFDSVSGVVFRHVV